MDTFNVPFHKTRTVYPDSSPGIQLGKGYSFAAKPSGPDQRKFVLTFKSMVYYVASNGTLDIATNTPLNYGTLDKFYQDHRTYQPFIYPHPAFGNITVRFAQPLQGPDAMEGGSGATEQFEVNLIEVL